MSRAATRSIIASAFAVMRRKFIPPIGWVAASARAAAIAKAPGDLGEFQEFALDEEWGDGFSMRRPAFRWAAFLRNVLRNRVKRRGRVDIAPARPV